MRSMMMMMCGDVPVSVPLSQMPFSLPLSNPTNQPILRPTHTHKHAQTRTNSYVGEHAFDKADGKGKEYYKDGGRYEGEFSRNEEGLNW